MAEKTQKYSFGKDLASRRWCWEDSLIIHKGDYYFNDNGVMYLISQKASRDQQFRTILKMGQTCVKKMRQSGQSEQTFIDTIEFYQDEIDVADAIEKVMIAILDIEQRKQASFEAEHGYFPEREDTTTRLGMWLQPSAYCIAYDKPTEVVDLSPQIQCFDWLFCRGMVNNDGALNVVKPVNFRRLFSNVFGCDTEQDYFDALSAISRSFFDTAGDHKIIFVKGRGGSGKSTLVNILTKVFKGLIVEVSEQVFSGKIAAYDLLDQKRMMQNAHTFVIDEATSGEQNNNILKKITSGTQISVRELGKNGGTLQIRGTILYFGNNDLMLDKIDTGTRRRLICFESKERKEWIDFEGRNFEELFLQERNGIIMDFLMAMQDADKVTYKDVKIVFSNEDNIADQYFDFEDDAVLIKQDLTDWGNHYFGRNATKVKSLADYLQERVDSKFKPMHSKEYNRTIYALKGVKLKS